MDQSRITNTTDQIIISVQCLLFHKRVYLTLYLLNKQLSMYQIASFLGLSPAFQCCYILANIEKLGMDPGMRPCSY